MTSERSAILPKRLVIDRGALAEVLALFALALVLVRLSDSAASGHPTIRGLVPPLVWIYLPLATLLLRRRNPWAYGLDLGDWRGALRDAALALVAVLPLYLVGHYVFQGVIRGYRFHFRIPAALTNDVLGNLLGVAFPEEAFFRGYVLGRLEDALGPDRRFRGGRLGPAVVISAVLFNAAHPLAGGHWWQGNVPFGLLLGWLRTRRESLVAPALVHGLTNVVFGWAELCFSR